MGDLIVRLLDGLRAAVVAIVTAVASVGANPPPTAQGYVEGEFVRVAAPASGTLERLLVARGDHVQKGEPLFELDMTSERAARDQAVAHLRAAEARLADLRKGKRDPEIEVIAAQKAQAEAMRDLAAVQLRRQEQLAGTAAASKEQLDAARASHERDVARVNELAAQLEVARMSARSDEIDAAEAAVAAARATLAQAEWRLAERSAEAPAAARVTDTLYRAGEYVTAGTPIVELLPPGNVKLRFFVPEPVLGGLQVGDPVTFACDGCPADLGARISFIAPEAEYTPPVIYSRESRAKLVFLVEAEPDGASSPLHPGQPVDVRLSAP
ncbi:MAG TPA: HlyD family efflux transporter periplasmic adaptor subunit [Geminicoccaceae bacterium]|nr:HlyD family efflux transporter periplasmic adaptor subunit [Geminicoccaceae bacterium]